MPIAVSMAQGLTVLCVIGAVYATWKAACSAHDKIDWVKDDMEDRETAMSLDLSAMHSQVNELVAKVDRLSSKLQDRELDKTRVRMKKIKA